MRKKVLFDEPLGPSKGIAALSTQEPWNNMSIGTTMAVTCELCGTEHPQRHVHEDGYTLCSFLGMQVVEQCCGKVFDILYNEVREKFTLAFLQEFAARPLDPRFLTLRSTLRLTLDEASKLASEIRTETKRDKQIVEALEVAKRKEDLNK
jgi:hypothetical protein